MLHTCMTQPHLPPHMASNTKQGAVNPDYANKAQHGPPNPESEDEEFVTQQLFAVNTLRDRLLKAWQEANKLKLLTRV